MLGLGIGDLRFWIWDWRLGKKEARSMRTEASDKRGIEEWRLEIWDLRFVCYL
jgi:hypothetical protein